MDTLGPIRELAADWERDADTVRRRGAAQVAAALESCAADLRERITTWELEALDLSAAAHESGLAYDTVQRKVASGEIPNVGRKHAPRVRRVDLHPWIEVPAPTHVGDPVSELADVTLAGREVRP